MNKRGSDKLLASKFTLGVEGSVAAGPVGRTATAQTDLQMKADILSWSRSQGLFAGVALEGATLRQDLDDNATLYGKKLENRAIVSTGVTPPESAEELLSLLNKFSAREGGKISSHQPATETKHSPMGPKENPITLSRAHIIKVQESLNEKGFDVGTADGLMGRRTREGIRGFQKQQNMPVTGRLDAETAGKLGIHLVSATAHVAGADR
jgi:hypothetical protein